jgi:thiamine-monophosphate kinase
MMVEGVHFRRQDVPPSWIGWKALACNVSDIAAMGGLPHWAVVSLGLPPKTSVSFVDGVYAGLKRCARRFGMSIVGGDTVRAPQVVVDVAILGTVERGRLTLRSGARAGDALFVTGRLGGSLRSGRHAAFVPRLREAQALVRRVRVRAMMDLSDGLASDLWQLSRASRAALRVEATRIPIARAAWTSLPRQGGTAVARRRQALRHALMDGEDFELLFAVGARDAARVPRRLGACPVTRIGTVIGRGVNVELVHPDGRVSRLVPRGFQHFS